MSEPYLREVWSGKLVFAVQVECGLCTKVEEPLHTHITRELNEHGWRHSSVYGWLCADCWPNRALRYVIWPEDTE